MGWHANILATPYRRRDASEKGSHDHGEGNPEDQLWYEHSLEYLVQKLVSGKPGGKAS